MEKRRIRPRQNLKSVQDVSVQWVEDKVRGEIDRAFVVILKERVEPIEEVIRLLNQKLVVLGSFLNDTGISATEKHLSARALLEDFANLAPVLEAISLDELREAAGNVGIACDGEGNFRSVGAITREISRASHSGDEARVERSQDDIIADALDNMIDELDV